MPIEYSLMGSARHSIVGVPPNKLLAPPLFLKRAKECLHPLSSAILILVLQPNGCVGYSTVEAEDTRLRVSECAVRLRHVSVYPRQSCHDGSNSVSTHNRQKVRGRCF